VRLLVNLVMPGAKASSLIRIPMHRFLLFLLVFLLPACTTVAPVPLPTVTFAPTSTASSIPPSSTPEPAATALPPSPTPLPRFFTEQFDGILPAWSLLQVNGTSTPLVRLDNGELTFELALPYQWAYAIVGGQSYDDVRLDALLRSRGTAPEALGLLCRYSEENGWYEFNVSSDGTYNVLFGHWLDAGVAEYYPIAADNSEYLMRGAEQNEIGLACQGDVLWLYVNGKLFRKLDVTRFGLKEGSLGLGVASFENSPVVASFDWLRVSQP
jgi:hypothetical protein